MVKIPREKRIVYRFNLYNAPAVPVSPVLCVLVCSLPNTIGAVAGLGWLLPWLCLNCPGCGVAVRVTLPWVGQCRGAGGVGILDSVYRLLFAVRVDPPPKRSPRLETCPPPMVTLCPL